jgi:hypothetical protein
MFKGLARL